MAVKEQKNTFNSIMKSLSQGQYAPIYLLMGDEGYYIDKITDFIAENALPQDQRDFNQTIVYAADTSAVKIAEMAKQYPMMAERQVIILKEAQGIKDWEPIEKYLEQPQATTILVIAVKNSKIDKRKKIVAKADAVGVLFESPKVREAALPPFILQYLSHKNVTIDDKATQMIADHIGTDLNRMVTELDKLEIGLDDTNRHITPQIVEDRIGISKDYNFFELKDAIVAKDVLKANRIANYFDKNPRTGSIYSMLPLLFSFFQNLMIAYYAPNRNDARVVAQFLGMKSAWGADSYVYAMKNYTGKKTMDIISKIREIDAKSKGLDNPNTPEGELMKELIYFIMH